MQQWNEANSRYHIEIAGSRIAVATGAVVVVLVTQANPEVTVK